MLKKGWIVLVFMLLPGYIAAQADAGVKSGDVLETNDYFAGLYPRLERSEGEREALE